MTGRMTAVLPHHHIGSPSVSIGLEGGQPPDRPRMPRTVYGDESSMSDRQAITPSPRGGWLRWTLTVPGRSASLATRKPGSRSSPSTGDARSPATVKSCNQRTLRLAMGRRRREEATR